MTRWISADGRWRWVALGLLVVLSTVARALAARTFTAPWIVPDEPLYAMLGESLWERGEFSVRGIAVPYYTALVPVLTGWPFAFLEVEKAIETVQWLNAALMAMTAIPVFLWARRLAGQAWALGAATVVLCAPGFLYSGFVMSEAAFLPFAVVALWALARMLVRPDTISVGLFALTVALASGVRLQALALVPAAALAAGLYAVMQRSTRPLKQLLPFAAAGVGVLLVVVAIALAADEPLTWNRLLGAYGAIAEEREVAASAISMGLWHVATLAFSTLVLPFVAAMALGAHALSGREHDRGVCAFLAVALAWPMMLVGQTGVFAATYTGNVAERYLLTGTPLLAIALVLWLSRGAPGRRVAAVACGVVVVLAVLIPLDMIADSTAFVANPFAGVLVDLVTAGRDGWARGLLVGAALVAGVIVVLMRTRAQFVAALAVAAIGLGVMSALATREAADASRAEQSSTIGDGSRSWVDASHPSGPVSLLVTGERLWTADARTAFWNQSVREALRLRGAVVRFPPAATVAIGDDGFLVDGAGRRVEREWMVAASTVQLVGEVVVDDAGRGSATFGERLWRIDGPVRVVVQVVSGLDPVGDIGNGIARIVTPGCVRGRLDVTFVGKTAVRVTGYVNGIPAGVVDLEPGDTGTVSFATPLYVDGSKPCTFDLDVPTLTGTTRIAFVPDGG